MTVGEGKKYCGEHMIVAGESEVSACSLKLKVEEEESRSLLFHVHLKSL